MIHLQILLIYTFISCLYVGLIDTSQYIYEILTYEILTNGIAGKASPAIALNALVY